MYTFFIEQWDGTPLVKTKISSNMNINRIGKKKQFNSIDIKKNSMKLDSSDKLCPTKSIKVIEFGKKPDKVITVIDSRQSRLQGIIYQIIQRLDSTFQRYQYLGYEAVALSQQTVKEIGMDIQNENKQVVHMSGRKGVFINGDYILDQLRKKSIVEIMSRNKDIKDAEINNIAEGIAISALRYSLIKKDLDKMITFDIMEELNLDGDTSLYLQYSYARGMRILEKSNLKIRNKVKIDLLNNDIEKEMIKEILKYDMIVQESVDTLSPKIVARYANRLATKFNVFYENIPVLNVENADLKVARLSIVNSFCILLRGIFLLLGIEALNRL
jgi:arginyl-tRNA synthetase